MATRLLRSLISFSLRSDYKQQSVAFLRIKKDFIHKSLVELTSRYDVDTLIDVHTHPFSQTASRSRQPMMETNKHSFSF